MSKLRRQKEQQQKAKRQLEERQNAPSNICGVNPEKVTGEFMNYRALSYGQRYVLHASVKDWILLKQMQNYPQRKDMRRVSLGNLKCYKDVKHSEIIEEKLQRVNHFLYYNKDVYPVFSSSVQK
jgi:hypothetical protein